MRQVLKILQSSRHHSKSNSLLNLHTAGECETAVSKSTEKTTQENSPETVIERWPTSSETQEPLPSSPSRSNPPPGALHQIIQQSTANT
ncbi:hypothetical protein Pcinc_005487 [Petrolisthes cinctipes]|uniref:Uncharacterized protein n=1 Tax=Petrolisthes cinctipes TaxID=88211 RepID=A0AAE1GEZ3_PETCI|nr:hypothetical protein Pcinc_005487 [Petrolisthes cinctipes]